MGAIDELEELGDGPFRITDLQWKGESQRRARIYIDGEWWMTLERDVIDALEIKPGRELTGQERRRLELDVAYEKSKLFLMRSLSVRAQTRAELARKLKEREVPEEAAARALDAVTSYGFIDDAEVARSLASSMQDRGYGRRRVSMKLREKGIADEIAEELIEEMFPGESELVAARRALRNRQVSDDPKHMKRLADFLLRRGFSYGAASGALRELVEEAREAAEAAEGVESVESESAE